MITYSYNYQHKTKEVFGTFQVGLSPPMKFAVSAEVFIQDIDFMKNDKKLAHFLAEVRRRKDLPIDHDFGDAGELKFDADDWGKKMGEN